MQRNRIVSRYISISTPFYFLVCLLVGMAACTIDYPANVIAAVVTQKPAKPDSVTVPISTSSTPVSSTTVSPGSQSLVVDSLTVPPPNVVPNGGSFHVQTAVQLTADTLPPQAVVEFSVDKGQTWQAGQQFTVTSGGAVLTRLRVGDKVSRTRTALFSLYFERMLVIGNSIMSHGPAPDLGWFNANGMAASAPEKDFVHRLTAYLQANHMPLAVKLQSGGNFENSFGTAAYSIDEFTEPLQTFKPDLIIVRIGENIQEDQVVPRNLDLQFRLLLERLSAYNQPVKIVVTTSVWNRPQADAAIRKVTAEKNYPLVDLSSLVGQGQYFASQYANPGVAAHPNDAGMQRITDLIWAKVQ